MNVMNEISKTVLFFKMLHAAHVMYYAYMWLSASTKTSIALMFSSLLNEFSPFPPELSSLLLCGPVCLSHRKGRWFHCGPISCRLDTYKRNIRNCKTLDPHISTVSMWKCQR